MKEHMKEMNGKMQKMADDMMMPKKEMMPKEKMMEEDEEE